MNSNGTAAIAAYIGSNTSVTIPSTIGSKAVTVVGSDFSAVFDSSVKSVTIPNSVTSIGEWAFYGCSSLTSVTIPDSVEIINSLAFANCSGLTSVTIGKSAASVVILQDYAFTYCENLTEIIFSGSVTTIWHYAFSNCSSLISVKFGSSTPPSSVGMLVFTKCDPELTLYVPEGSKEDYASSSLSDYYQILEYTISADGDDDDDDDDDSKEPPNTEEPSNSEGPPNSE